MGYLGRRFDGANITSWSHETRVQGESLARRQLGNRPVPGSRHRQPGRQRGRGPGQPPRGPRTALRAAASDGGSLSSPTDENVGWRAAYFFLEGLPLGGRCDSAEPAAVLAPLLEFGFRRTLDAAEAALLLVTPLLGARFAIWHLLSTTIHHIATQVDWRWILPNDKRKNG